MNCPNCQNQELEKIVFHQTKVDFCDKCLGMWFDADELRAVKDDKDENLKWLDIDLWKDEKQFQLSQSQKACPKDGSPMYETQYNDSGIGVDVCNLCRGIWLDRGEFKKIIDYLKEKAYYETAYHFWKNLAKEVSEVFIGPQGLKDEIADVLILLKILNYKFLAKHPYSANIIASLPK
ncbi:MAG: zf-TFIIB domain-containing protein [Patescibacteria group bacterium]|nr:zf-TFIIB domain-containing protein [Patescibacteria group bacterium]